MKNSERAILERLREMLVSDRFATPKRLPPERTLASDLGISRAVLRKALATLEREGKIWRHVGRGTFIGSLQETNPWDERLHWSIAKATDNSLLISLFTVIQKMRQSNIYGSLKEASLTNVRRKIYYQQHCELVEALKDRNAVKAEQLMREHLEMVRRHLLDLPHHV